MFEYLNKIKVIIKNMKPWPISPNIIPNKKGNVET